MKCVPFTIIICICQSSPSNVQNTLKPRHQLTKLRSMTISIKIKVLIKFGASEAMCVDLRAIKL